MIKKKSPSVLIKEVRQNISFGFGDLRDVSFTDAKNDSAFFIDYIQHLRQFIEYQFGDIYKH